MSLAFEQRRDKHAIGQFDASLFFFQPANASTFARAVSELEGYARENDLPAPINRQVFQFDLGQPESVQSFSPQSAGWQRYASTGEVETAVVLDENGIHFTCRNYSSWKEMLPRIVQFFVRVGTPILAEVPAITKFQINYQNQFRCVDLSGESGAEIFREKNGWVAPYIFRFQDAWHSNSGAFEGIEKQYRRLINVNCSCRKQKEVGQAEQFTYVDANLLVAECYDIPEESPLVIPQQLFKKVLLENFDNAHTREKEVLRELISDEYLALMKAQDE